MAVQPLHRKKIVKKTTRVQRRFQSDSFMRLKSDSHRALHGIDNGTRRRFKGTNAQPKIGNKQESATRHNLPHGFKKLLITGEKDIELLLMNNRIYCGEIA